MSQIATFASGCYWGTQAIFDKYFKDKLIKSTVGFIGGPPDLASYSQVCTGRTKHAEAVQLVYDSSRVSYEELCEFFFRSHDPTQENGQGNDLGSQYRSAIFTHNEKQYKTAKEVRDRLQRERFGLKRIITLIEMKSEKEFYPAEEYHQKYLEKNPDGYRCETHKLHW